MEHRILEGVIVENDVEISLAELCRICKIDAEWIVTLVQEGILEPTDTASKQWHFSGTSLRRALIVRRLQRDLEVNLAGAALILELLEEREALRTRLDIR
jgi:chaperone modulatory protein CbpM